MIRKIVKRVGGTTASLFLLLNLTACGKGLEGLSTASAVLLAALLMPFSNAYHSLFGYGRALHVHEVYENCGVIALANSSGYFTDDGWESQSAWIIDVDNPKPDKKGRIILSESNLEPHFFRDTDLSVWKKLLHYETEENKYYYTPTTDFKSMTIHRKDGTVYTVYLKQSGNYR